MTSSWSRAPTKVAAVSSSLGTPKTGLWPPSTFSPCCGVWRGPDDSGATGNIRRFGVPRGPRTDGNRLLRLPRSGEKSSPPARSSGRPPLARLPPYPSLCPPPYSPQEETPVDTLSPERSGTPRSGWDQSHWGIYLADLYARAPAASPPLPGLPLNRGAHPPSVHHRGCHWPGRLALVHGGSRPSPRRPPPRGKHIITFLLPI